MKKSKALSLLLSMSMISAYVINYNVYATVPEPSKFFAGTSAITLTYESDTDASAAAGETATLINSSGEVVATSAAAVNGNIVTYTVPSSIARDTGYTFNMGDTYSQRFKLTTVWEADLSGAKTVRDQFILPLGMGCYNIKDNQLLASRQQNYNDKYLEMFAPNYAGQTTEEDLAFNYDERLYKDDNWKGVVFGLSFNTQRTDWMTMSAYKGHSDIEYNTSATWAKDQNDTNVKRGIMISTADNNKSGYVGSGNGLAAATTSAFHVVTNSFSKNISAYRTFGSSSASGSPTIDNPNVVYSITSTNSAGVESPVHHFSVNKTGATASLFIDNELQDVYNTQSFVEGLYTSSNITGSYEMPKTGYFVLSRYLRTGEVSSYTNMNITKCEIIEPVVGEMLVESIRTQRNNVIITFDQTTEFINDSDINDFITIEDSDGNPIEYSVVSKSQNAITLNANITDYTKTYTVTVAEGLGYDEVFVTMTASEDVTFTKFQINDFYAGAGSVTVEYTDEFALEDIGEITLTDSANNDVAFTANVKGNKLIIVPQSRFTRDTESYKLRLGEVTKNFKIKTAWQASFDGATGDYSSVRVKRGSPVSIGVTADNKLAVKSKNTIFVPNLDTNTQQFKNASFIFDVKYTNGAPNLDFSYGFNLNKWDESGYLANNLVSSINTNVFFWRQKKVDNPNLRGYRMGNDHSKFEGNPDTKYLVQGSGHYGNSVTFEDGGKATIVDDALKNSTPYEYSIDKIGATANLVINNTLVDTYDTQKEVNNDNINADVPNNGYFFLGDAGAGDWGIYVISAMAVTTFEIVPGEPVVEDIVDFYAGTGSITVKYGEAFELPDVGVITLKDSHGNVINTSATVDNNTLVITPSTSLTRDTEVYTLTIGHTTKTFKLNTVWEPTFDTTNGTVSGVNNTSLVKYGVTADKEMVVQTKYGSVIPNVNEYKNASFNFDVKFADTPAFVCGFNLAKNDMNYIGYIENANDKVSRYFWLTNGNSVINRRGYLFVSEENRFAGTANAISQHTLTNAGSVTGTLTSGGGAVSLSENFGKAYHYSIDKTGAKANLVIDNSLVDIYDTASLGSQDEYGYFVIGGDNPERTFVLSNMSITTCELLENIKITQATFLGENNEALTDVSGASSVHGTLSVKSTYGSQKPIKVVVTAYSGNKMIAIDTLQTETIASGDTISGNYSFTGLTGLTEIKVLVWDQLNTMVPYDFCTSNQE